MNKNKRKKENANQKNMILENAFDKKVKDFVGEMIENLKKNKEAYIVICTALGLVINAIWNIACGIGYRGYADGLNISTQFIQKDNQNILLSILIFLGVAVLFYLIYKIAKKVYRKKRTRRVILGIVTALAFSPFVILFLYNSLPSTKEIINLTSYLWAGLSLTSCVFLIVYLPILDILIDIEKKRLTDMNSSSEQDQGGEHKPISKIVVGAKATGMWLVALISLLMAIYCFGRYGASSQIDFDFIVDKYDYSFTYDGNVVYDNIILSETDELYYLSVCTISGSADNATITIYPNYHSIVKKGDEPINVIRKRFSTTHFVK